MEMGLLKLKEQAEKSKRPDRQKVERRIGRLLDETAGRHRSLMFPWKNDKPKTAASRGHDHEAG